MKRIKFLLCLLLLFLSAVVSMIFASIYNEGDIIIYGSMPVSNQTSEKSGSVVANITTMSHKIPSIIVSSNVKFSYNTTYVSGTILNSEDGILTIGANVKFSSNTAFESGGAIYNLNLTSVTIIGDNVDFSSNTATNAGGAIYSIGNLEIRDNVTFYGNKYTSASVKGMNIYGVEVLTGGAIYQNGGSIETERQKYLSIGKTAKFDSNAAYKGGAIYVILSSVTMNSSATFKNNSANYRGGAVYLFKSTFTVKDGVDFSSNSATNRGGAIYSFDSILNFNAKDNEVIFSSNSAIEGGGIYSVNGEINLNAETNNITFDGDSSIKSTGTTVMNIKTGTLRYVFFDADVIMDSGTINFNSTEEFNSGEVMIGSNCKTFNVGALNLSSGTFSLSTGCIENNSEIIQTVNVSTFTSTEKVNLNIDITLDSYGNTDNDKFNIENTASGVINLSKINISTILSDYGTITLFKNGNLEKLRIMISTKPVYSGVEYAFFLNPEDGKLDFSKISPITGNILSSTEIRASTMTGTQTITSGTVTTHLAIYGNGSLDEFKVSNGNIVISSYGALSLLGFGKSSSTVMSAQAKVINKNYLYAENVKFSQNNITNLSSIEMDSSTIVSILPSNNIVKFIAYDSSFDNLSIINESSITLKNIDKSDTKNFTIKVKLSSVTISSASTSFISESTYIKIDNVKNTNVNNKIICSVDSATFNNNVNATNGGVIYSGIKGNGIDIDSNTSSGIVVNFDIEHNIGDNVNFLSNKASQCGGVIYSSNSIPNDRIDNFASVKNSSFTSTFSFSVGNNVNFCTNTATNAGGAIYNFVEKSSASVSFNTNFVLGSNVLFSSNTVTNGNGGAVYNRNGEITFEDGVNFSSNSASTNKGGAIYNEQGTINLTAKESDIIFNCNEGEGGAIYDSSGIINVNVYNNKKISFLTSSDTIVSFNTTSVLNINKDIGVQDNAIIEINANMSGFIGTTNINSGFFKFGKDGDLFGGKTVIENATFDFSNKDEDIKNYNLSNFKINGNLNLIVDVNLAEKKMDSIYSNSTSNGSGNIRIREFVLIGSATSAKTIDILFTSATALKGKVSSSITASSDEYIYDVEYDNNTGYFTFVNRFIANPTTLEGSVALLAGAMATQENVLNQAFVSMNTSFTNRHDRRLDLVNSKNLYASTENYVFLNRTKIEGGLWLRPYAYKEDLTVAGYDVESTIYGALAGLDLKITDTKLLSFYIGYTGVNEKFENIKIDQNGYVFGATGMFVKESFYAGVTANAGVSDTTAESSKGSNDFQINTYTLALKGGYEFKLSDVCILDPNILLMYGYMDAEKYITEQRASVSKEGFNNFHIEPQVKFKIDLYDGWKPYALLGYVINTGETNAVVNGNKKQTQKLDPYCEYGAGLEKNFIGTAWVGYIEITGKAGGKRGAGINLGIKYAF